MRIVAGTFALLFLSLALPARAERIPAKPGKYVGDSEKPVMGEMSPLQCPGIAKVTGTTLTFPLQAFNNELKYGTIKVTLDASGSFHGNVPLPRVKPTASMEADDVATFITPTTVMVDVDTAAIGGSSGAALLLKVTLPSSRPGRESVDFCRRTLLDVQLPKVAKTNPFDGWYYLRTGDGHGHALVCPPEVVISAGKAYFSVPRGYTSWVADGIPLDKKGSFDNDLSFAKMPPGSELARVGEYQDTIREIQGVSKFHLHGGFETVHIVHQHKDTRELTLKVTSDDISECGGQYYLKGVDFGGGYPDCDHMNAAQRKLHPVCD